MKTRKSVKRVMTEYDFTAFAKSQHLVVSIGIVSLKKLQDTFLQPLQRSKIRSSALNFHSSFSLQWYSRGIKNLKLLVVIGVTHCSLQQYKLNIFCWQNITNNAKAAYSLAWVPLITKHQLWGFFLSLMLEVVTLFHGKRGKSYNGKKYNRREFKQI